MKFRTILVFGFLFTVSLWGEPPRPSNVPKGAIYNEKYKNFILEEREEPFLKRTRWDSLGILVNETYSLEGLTDATYYIDGRWYSREQSYGFSLNKAKILPPREKPSSIPKEAEFNFDFRKWELGETKEGKKEGVWKLWWPTGEAGGSVEYKNGVYDGKLNVIWENGKTKETCVYASGKEDGEKLLYHESGKLHWTVKYVHGLKEGESFQYYDTGELKYRTLYAKGEATMQERFENGKLVERRFFKNKKVIKHEKF
ncbi:MORN repeat protein [Leptospira alstonii serovar Pingchang str. 80-412]|uniref:MORN repeat protein n=2 Tax=Leptospira alstonii TaxID=28452 RepID=T0H873_9LEPT|nr:MORN repeat protein [Leptospira alstonii]EQA79983.1 MORN repeat protein [Leptospira alstonii serovar Pingchang str. 80-412]